MIKRFLPNETVYDHNKYVLKPRDVKVVEEANGIFELEINLPKGTEINKRDIITAPTHMGTQPFRVYRVTKTLYGKKAFARHIFYDLTDALLLDSRPTSATCNDALQTIINATGYIGWSYLSDITDRRTAYYIRKNPVEAIIGADNSVLNVWGGYLVRDNKEIRIMQSGIDRNYKIRLGKNLIGIEDDSDDSSVVTRLYPTYEKDQVIYDLPEKYVDSPLVGNYPNPIVKEIRVALTDDEKEYTDAQIHQLLRDYCNNLYSVDNVDKPIANYKIDFVELSKIAQLPQYRQYTYAGLEQMTYATIQTLTYAELQSTTVIESFVGLFEKVEMHDIVTINVSELDIDLKAQVIKVEYDSLGDRYTKIELGGFKPSNKYQINNIVKQLQIDKDKATDEYKALYDLAINKVTGNKGGYQVTRFNANNEPYETLWMDTPDVTTAVNVLRINQNGIAGSNNGINGEYKLAITTDGWIVAERILANQLSAISANLGTVTAGRIQDADNESYWDLNTKEMSFNLNSLQINSKDVATKEEVTQMIDNINSAKPNLVTNLPDNWEQGDINSSGSLVSSLANIRNKAYFPIRQGYVTFTVSPLYQAKIIIYDSNYNFKASYGFSGEYTFLLDTNAYFKMVLKRTNGSDITIEAIATAELKVENSDVATQFTPYFGDLTLEQQNEFYVLDVQSNKGWVVDTPNYSTTLTCKIYLFNEDVTLRFEPYQFTWFKQYPDGTLISLGNGTSKTITGSSIEKSATITCSFEIYDTIYLLATYNGDTLLTMSNDNIIVTGDYQ